MGGAKKKSRREFLTRSGAVAAGTVLGARALQGLSSAQQRVVPKRIDATILAVAIAPPTATASFLLTDVVPSGDVWNLRNIIRSFARGLQAKMDTEYPAPASRSTFRLDYIEGPPGADLKDQIKSYFQNPSLGAPQVILTVASAATKAAQDAEAELGKKIPIVFTVVSDPKIEGFVTEENAPGKGITGISSRLIQTAGECGKQMRTVFAGTNAAFKVHAFPRTGLVQAQMASANLAKELGAHYDGKDAKDFDETSLM